MLTSFEKESNKTKMEMKNSPSTSQALRHSQKLKTQETQE